MLWVLWDIVLPLVATFLLGLFVGWLLWRWRRSHIDAEGLSTLRRSAGRYKSDAERLQRSNVELSDRLQAASGAGGGELASAKKRIDMLAEELKSSRREVAELKTANRSNTGSVSSASQSKNDSEQVRALQAQLQGAQRKVADMEKSSGSNSTGSVSEADLRKEIAARDHMIATLKESHNQFGEKADTTSLLADVALRDRKISDLEALLAKLRS